MGSKEKVLKLRAENQLLGSVIKELKSRVSELEARASKSKSAAAALRVHEEALRELRSLLEDSRNECSRLRVEKEELADAALDLSDELAQARQRIGRTQEEVSSLQARVKQVSVLEATVASLLESNASLAEQNASLAAERDATACSAASTVSSGSTTLGSAGTGEGGGVARLEMLSRATLSSFHAQNLSATSSSGSGKDAGEVAAAWADRLEGSPPASAAPERADCQACAALRAQHEEREGAMRQREDELVADKAALVCQVARLQAQDEQARTSLEESQQAITKLRAEADWLYHHAQRLRGEQLGQLARGEELMARLASVTAHNRQLVEQCEASGRQLDAAQGEVRELRDALARGVRPALHELAASAKACWSPVAGTPFPLAPDALLLEAALDNAGGAEGGACAPSGGGALPWDMCEQVCCCHASQELRPLKVYARVLEVDLASERAAAERSRAAQAAAQVAARDVQQQLDAALEQCAAGLQALELELRHVSALEKLRSADLQEILDLEKHNRAIQQESWYLREVIMKQRRQLVVCQCLAR